MKTLKLKTALLALAAVGMLSISSCKKEKEVKNLSVSNISYTDCLSESKNTFNKDLSDPDSIVYSYENNTLYITHYNLDVPCGNEIYVNIDKRNDTIDILEWADDVNCYCTVNNSFQINNLEKGNYILVFKIQGIVLPINL